MKLSELLPDLIGRLQSDAFLSSLTILSNVAADHNQRLGKALQEQGIALVVVLVSGSPTESRPPRLKLANNVLVSILENPAKNQTGKSCLEVAERVLEVLHQSSWPSQRGLQHELTVDNPAYEAGSLDAGLVVYFCNLRVLTLQP
jgi:hypothetical protein